MKYYISAYTVLEYKVIYNNYELSFSVTSSASASGYDFEETKQLAGQLSREAGFKEEKKVLTEVTNKYNNTDTYYDAGSVAFINNTSFTYDIID